MNLSELKTFLGNLRLHKEGFSTIANILVWLLILNGMLFFLQAHDLMFWLVVSASIIFFSLVLYFFRNPKRKAISNENCIYAPADGKIVVIETTDETEYLNEKRIQVSIFMSPLNVHVNRMPSSGAITYFKYHPGKFLVAWHPKSSTENERTTVVYKTLNGVEILLRQIAGAVARRIICYAIEGKEFSQGQDFGFIRFGSRVDIFLPLNAEIKVHIGQITRGNETVIAQIK